MNPQAAATPGVSPYAGAAAPGAASGITPSPAVASARPTRIPVPTPSLKPGEVITWIRLERPRLALGDILVGSFALVGLIVVMAVSIGVVLGHLRSKRTDTHGTGGLRLR